MKTPSNELGCGRGDAPDPPSGHNAARAGGAGGAGGAPTGLARRIALVSASPGVGDHGVAAVLLADFADALLAYARQGTDSPREVPQIETFAWGRPGSIAVGALAGFDAVVLFYPACAGHLPGHVAAILKGPAQVRPLGRARLYALAYTDGEPWEALDSLDQLEGLCSRAGVTWSGGLAVGGGRAVLAARGRPRMGFVRGPVSEATDELILAVRGGVAAGRLKAAPRLARLGRWLAHATA